jgi:hypothetical protein
VLSVVFAGLLTLTSITTGIGQTQAVTASGSLNCRDPIGSDAPPRTNSETVGGAAALLTGFRGGRALGTARVSEPLLPSHRYWSKTPLYVRPGKKAEIRVPRSERGWIAMTWGNTASDPLVDRTFSVGPCSAPTGWIVFPGGYFVTRPGCYTLIVSVKQRDTKVEVGVGAPCPGQQQPTTST